MSESLASRFNIGAEAADIKPTLAARKDDFSRAISSGGSREDYATWRASVAALEAALEILSNPQSEVPTTRHQGDEKWQAH